MRENRWNTFGHLMCAERGASENAEIPKDYVQQMAENIG
jgi:hypothetical protein